MSDDNSKSMKVIAELVIDLELSPDMSKISRFQLTCSMLEVRNSRCRIYSLNKEKQRNQGYPSIGVVKSWLRSVPL